MTAYATIDQVKARIPITSNLNAVEETMFTEMLEAASRLIEGICGESEGGFIAEDPAEVHYYASYGEDYLVIDPCMEISSVAVKESATATTYTSWTTPSTPLAGDGDWIPCRGTPEDPIYGKTPYTILKIDPNGDYEEFLDSSGLPAIKVTAKGGRNTSCPADIREATIMQCIIWHKRYSAAMAKSGGATELGQLMYRRALDSAVVQILIDGGHYLPLYGGR